MDKVNQTLFLLVNILLVCSCTTRLPQLQKSDCPIKSDYVDINLWKIATDYNHYCIQPILTNHCYSYPGGGYYGHRAALLEEEDMSNWKKTLERSSFQDEIPEALSMENPPITFPYDSLPDLKVLKLIDIASVPAGIKRFKKLKVLHIQSKRLTRIPDWIGGISTLEVLSIYDGSSLTYITESIHDLSNLKQIYLEDIPYLDSFNIDYAKFPKLEKILLEGNYKDYLNESVSGCNELKYLTTSTYYPYINQISQLKMLVLPSLSDANDIQDLSNHTTLEELFVFSFDSKSDVHPLFSILNLRNIGLGFGYQDVDLGHINNDKLEYISLKGERLNTFPKLKTPNLRYINFKSNDKNLDIIIPKSLTKLPFLEFAHLEGNAIKEIEFDTQNTRFGLKVRSEYIR